MWSLVIIAVLSLVLALVSAIVEDEQRIARIHANDRREADHWRLTIMRAAILCPSIALLVILLPLEIHWSINTLLLVATAYGTFTPMHRLVLNELAKKRWWYMDDLDPGGNVYDEIWWMIGYALFSRTTPVQVARMAFGFELMVLLITVWIALAL
jgi:hypothetical protein